MLFPYLRCFSEENQHFVLNSRKLVGLWKRLLYWIVNSYSVIKGLEIINISLVLNIALKRPVALNPWFSLSVLPALIRRGDLANLSLFPKETDIRFRRTIGMCPVKETDSFWKSWQLYFWSAICSLNQPIQKTEDYRNNRSSVK